VPATQRRTAQAAHRPGGLAERPEPSRKPQQGGGMHKLVRTRSPRRRGSRRPPGPPEGMRPEGAQDDAGGPEDPRPCERGAVIHGADRCKFQPEPRLKTGVDTPVWNQWSNPLFP
jgi:hypothetical protein